PVTAAPTRSSRTVSDERADEHHQAGHDARDPDPQPHARAGHEASLQRSVPLEGPNGSGRDQPDAEDDRDPSHAQPPNQRARRVDANAAFSAAVAIDGATNVPVGRPGVEKKSTSTRATSSPPNSM